MKWVAAAAPAYAPLEGESSWGSKPTPDDGSYALLPGKYRLLQLADARNATREHFAKLVDHRRGRRVNELTGEMKPDHAPRALGNFGKIERIGALDIRKRDPVHRSDLRGISRDHRAFRRPQHDG